MPYLVDTDIVIDYLAGAPEATQLLLQLAPEGLAISVITYMEAYEGVASATGEPGLGRFQAFVEGILVIPFSPAEARRCAQVREQLRRRGSRTRSRALDWLIAATAIEHNLTLVTRNVPDYMDIPGLRLRPLTAPNFA